LRLAESRSNQVADESNAEKLKDIVESRGKDHCRISDYSVWLESLLIFVSQFSIK